MGEALTISDLVAMLRRKAFLILVVVLFGTVAAVHVANSLPPVYTTSARVLIERQQISDELVRSSVNLSAAQRLQLIQERLMARDSLSATINRLGLFRDQPLSLAEKIIRLRTATRIESTPGTTQVWGTESPLFAFSISVEWGDPVEAATIVNEFVDSAISQNLEVRASQARETLLYLKDEERRINTALQELETDIAIFKKTNEAALPESLEFRRSELQRLQITQLENDRRMLELENKLSELTLILEEGAIPPTDAPISPEEIALRELEIELAQKRLLLAKNHPEISRLKRRIAAIEEVVAPTSVISEGRGSRLREQERRSTEVQIEQTSAQLQMLREQREANLRAQQNIEESLRRTPELEVASNRYDRQLTELQEQKTIVAQRLEEASKGAQLEVKNQSERFRVLETALVPDQPIGPNRLKYVVLGSGLSVGCALAIVLVSELLNPVLRSSAEMERRVGVRPVIAIPYIRTRAQRRRRAAGVLCCTLVLGSAMLWALSTWFVDDWGIKPERMKAAFASSILGFE